MSEPIPIFVDKDLGARDALAQLVTADGGELAQTMHQSVFLIVNPMSSDGQDAIDRYGDRPDKRVLRPEWLRICVVAGCIVIANDWAGEFQHIIIYTCDFICRGPPARKRPAVKDQFDAPNPAEHPRTDQNPTPLPMPPPAYPAPISYQYNPAYPLVPGYYPPAPQARAVPTPTTNQHPQPE